ncbi:MAG: AAA family ATPase [Blautia sp.]|nr:AAA family ATPase [Blautia sp.]
MNIKRAKEEIIDAIEAYLLKDEYGDYVIPVIHQRPILLLGAPGIGKTQIMEQIARQCNIALVAYTITHHTRQSAIGLPFVAKETFQQKSYTITEYTMSEIVASLYSKMEKTGLMEGILFIDEINCVSETLAPAMLQFLQYKSFGNHQIPPGWIIVAAGNPPEYNRSVREFDLVTMDRVKKIEVEPDFDVWKEYAIDAAVHPAILAYLNTKPLNFYQMETTVDGKFFATPRGWEDLSRMLCVYEKLSKKMDQEVVVQYIQYPQIAKDFANYLELYEKYEADYQIDEVFQGNIPDILIQKTAHASFDEKLSLIGLLLARCSNGFRDYCGQEDYLSMLHGTVLRAKELLYSEQDMFGLTLMVDVLQALVREREDRMKSELLTQEEKRTRLKVEDFWEKAIIRLRLEAGRTGEEQDKSSHDQIYELLKKRFAVEKEGYDAAWARAGENLEHAFDFLEAAFGTGQELVIFLTELNRNRQSLRFLESYDCERYYWYNKELLYEDRSRALLRKLEELS